MGPINASAPDYGNIVQYFDTHLVDVIMQVGSNNWRWYGLIVFTLHSQFTNDKSTGSFRVWGPTYIMDQKKQFSKQKFLLKSGFQKKQFRKHKLLLKLKSGFFILIDKVSCHQLRDMKFNYNFNQKLIIITNDINWNSLKKY